jgi:hypothetical protein
MLFELPPSNRPAKDSDCVNIHYFPAFRQDNSEAGAATVTSGRPDDGRGADQVTYVNPQS